MMTQHNIAKSNTINNFKGSAQSIKPALSIFMPCLIIFLISLISNANAEVLDPPQSTISYGVLSQTLSDQARVTIIKQNSALLVSDQITGKATGKSRDEIQKLNQTIATTGSVQRSISQSYAPEFSIYNAFTMLRDDFDGDGYYQTFSLVFDADIYSYDGNDIGEVYALLYLRENGGPWYHYYTTDNFIIHSDSDADQYEVITTFMAGYHPSHYDLLIDLYQVGYDGIVATYSSDDNSSLYDLPIESSDYDQVYVDSVEIQYGGGLSMLSLIMLFSLLASRLYLSLSHRIDSQS